jgi:rod shape-determining protein MreD
MKKFLILILSFYILALFQTSFLVHFGIIGYFLNLILIATILINLFVPHHSWWGITSAFIGGFFLDIFSENFIGFHILILLMLSLFIKFVFKKYVRVPIVKGI